MNYPVNPYVAGAPLREEQGFFGRQDVMDWVARELRNPATNSVAIFGQRRIGKTSLLLQLQRTLPRDVFEPVYFDLLDQATRPLGEVLSSLAKKVVRRIGLDPAHSGGFDNRGDFFCDTFLPQLYQALGEHRRPVFLLDEFDVLGQAAEADLPEGVAARALLPFLRRVMTEDSHPAFVFVVGRRAEDLELDLRATFKASLVKEVWVLDQESARTLVRQAEANSTLRFTDQALERILSLTCCHPYLTQLLCQRIWERAYEGNPNTPPRVDVSAVELAVNDALEVGGQAMFWLWEGLSPAEKIYAAALAVASDREGKIISEEQVAQVITNHAARLRARDVELAPRDLVRRRVLEVVKEREYRFAVELFRRWVRKNKSLREVENELDRVEPWAERLFSIGQEASYQGQRDEAVDFFQRALEKNPRHFRAQLSLGKVLVQLGQMDQAITELDRAYKIDQEKARYPLAHALVIQAQAHDEIGEEDVALAACERALQISPGEQAAQEMRTAIWTRRGDAALKREELETALAAYREAGDAEKIAQVEALQRQTLAYLEAEAQAHEQAKRWSEAIAILENIVNIDRTYKDSYVRLEHARAQFRLQDLYERAGDHFRNGNWPQAIRAFEMILSADPGYLDVAGKLEEARGRQQFEAMEGERLDALYAAGVQLLQRQSWERAVEVFRELVRIEPRYRDVWHRLDEAKRNATKFQDLEDLYCASAVYLEKEQWKAAIDYLRPILDSGEEYKDSTVLLQEAEKQLELQTLYDKAVVQLEKEQWDQAIDILEEIVRIDRSYEDSQARLENAQVQHRLQTLYNRALDHFRKENWDQAIKDLGTILRENPDFPGADDRLKKAQEQQKLAILYRAGVGFQETGRWEEAIGKFVEIIRWVGEHKDVASRLARAQRQRRLDRLFEEGMDHLRQREWQEAARKFEEVCMEDPDYRTVRARLEEAKRQLRFEELRKLGEARFRDEEWQEAIEVFEELHELVPRDSSLVTKLEEAKRQLNLDRLYREGMEDFRRSRWRKAETALERVVRTDSGYRDAAAILATTRERLARSSPVVEMLRDPLWQGIGGVGAIIALIIAVYPFIKGNLPSLVKPTSTPKPLVLCNGDFENNFECWQRGGELDQTVECDGDGCFAILGKPGYECEGGVPVGEAWIKQSFKVPENVSPTLSLRYRVSSYDLDTYDFFEVHINGEPVGQYGNTEWETSSCNREPWNSGWKSIEFDLSPYIGEEVELSLHNFNGENGWWNTWTYVDDVEVH